MRTERWLRRMSAAEGWQSRRSESVRFSVDRRWDEWWDELRAANFSFSFWFWLLALAATRCWLASIGAGVRRVLAEAEAVAARATST